MRTAELFLSNEGRLDRERWLGAVAALLLGIVAVTLLSWMLHRHGWIGAGARDRLRLFVGAAFAVMWVILDWKRFQDRGLPGLCALACPGLYALSALLAMLGIARQVPLHDFVTLYLGCAQFGVAVWYTIDLARLDGTPGANAYGPDPRGPAPRPVAAETVDARLPARFMPGT